MNKYDSYKQLKAKCDFVYKDIHLNSGAALTIWALANGDDILQLKSLGRALRTFIVPKVSNEKEIFAVFGRYDRKDYRDLFRMVIDKLQGKTESYHISECKRRYNLNIKHIINVAKFLFAEGRLRGVSLSNKLILTCEFVEYCNFIDYIESLRIEGVKKFLCMNSFYEYENILCQYFHNQGIESLSLSEGPGFIQRPCITHDCLSYENIGADKVLLWGIFTYKEYVGWGVPENRLTVAGYPKNYSLVKMKSDNRYKKCMVLLSRESFRHSNMSLLNILVASKYKFEVCLKLHPHSDFDFYKEFADAHGMSIIPNEKTLNESLNNDDFDFAIGVNTNAYFESLLKGLPCFRYKDDTFPTPGGYDDIFRDITEFEEKFYAISTMPVETYQQYIDAELTNVLGIGIDNYRKIILGEE